jgi:hypothetical protein
MMSMFSQFAGGKMTKSTAEALTEIGVLNSDDWHKAGGTGVKVNEGKLKQLTDAFSKDPLELVSKILLPAMAAKGITSPEDQTMRLFQILGRQTTQRFVADMIRNMNQMLTPRTSNKACTTCRRPGRNSNTR